MIVRNSDDDTDWVHHGRSTSNHLTVLHPLIDWDQLPMAYIQALTIGDVPFEDVRVPPEEFTVQKAGESSLPVVWWYCTLLGWSCFLEVWSIATPLHPFAQCSLPLHYHHLIILKSPGL